MDSNGTELEQVDSSRRVYFPPLHPQWSAYLFTATKWQKPIRTGSLDEDRLLMSTEN